MIHKTYDEYRRETDVNNLRHRLTGEGEMADPLREWEWDLLYGGSRVGMRVIVTTHDGNTLTIEDVRPDSYVWETQRGSVSLILSMETESDGIVYVPNVAHFRSESANY